MRNLTAPFRPGGRAWRFLCLELFAFALAPNLDADFVAPYAFSDFTLVNSANANGSAETPDGGRTILLIGPNDGSGLAGYTEFSIVARQPGQFRFSYVYSSRDASGLDFASYIVNGQVYLLTSASGGSGKVSVNVNKGDRIGFRIDSVDNIGEPGVLTISGFDPPAIPASSAISLAVLALFLSASGLLFLSCRLEYIRSRCRIMQRRN